MLAILDKHLSRSPTSRAEPTIADISMTSYLYYPAEEFGFDIAAQHKNIGAWLDRMKALPGWAHPYDLMPGHPLALEPSARQSGQLAEPDDQIGGRRYRPEGNDRSVRRRGRRPPCCSAAVLRSFSR